MVLIGTTSLSRTLDAGDFFCPTCHDNQTYRLCGVRVWITLYFIPVAPISRTENHVRCGQCHSKWDPSVLEMDDQTVPQARQEQFAAELLRACILAVQIAGEVNADDIEALLAINAAANSETTTINRHDLGMLCSAATASGIRAGDYLLTISRPWNHQQRLEAVGHLFAAVSASGSLHRSQSELLTRLKDIFHLTDGEYRDAIENMTTV